MPTSDEEKARIRRETEARRKIGSDRSQHEAARGVGAGKSSLSGLSRLERGLDDFDAVLARMKEESDRGAAIMGAALVESFLMQLLTNELAHKEGLDEVFRDKGAPLNSLSNKTIMAYAMGLIDKRTRNEIDQIRQIRNTFSHALLPIDFQTPEIGRVCKKLTRFADEYAKVYLPWREMSARYVFFMAASGIAQQLSNDIVARAQRKLDVLKKPE